MKTKLILFYSFYDKKHLTHIYFVMFQELNWSTVNYYEFTTDKHVELPLRRYERWVEQYSQYMEIIDA